MGTTSRNNGLKRLYDAKNGREIMEAILWKLRTGAPWRDIPQEFCPWETAYGRFNRWAVKGLWTDFFELRGDIDPEWVFADGSYVRAHQHASGVSGFLVPCIASNIVLPFGMHQIFQAS